MGGWEGGDDEARGWEGDEDDGGRMGSFMFSLGSTLFGKCQMVWKIEFPGRLARQHDTRHFVVVGSLPFGRRAVLLDRRG